MVIQQPIYLHLEHLFTSFVTNAFIKWPRPNYTHVRHAKQTTLWRVNTQADQEAQC
jgi:hypothetical protein